MAGRALSRKRNTLSITSVSSESINPGMEVTRSVSKLLLDAGIVATTTRSGWCLKQGLEHVLTADSGRLRPFVLSEGAPKIYDTENCRHQDEGLQQYKPQNCFQSLCRIISGQQLAGSAASAIWKRLIETTGNDLTPKTVLRLASEGVEDHLRKPAGLSNSKARSVIALSQSFIDQELSEELLKNSSEEQIREALMKVKGIGPWSCDMFLMFYVENSDVFPVGDLGVRKGLAKFFDLRGRGPKGSLCPQKDLHVMESVLKPYSPYRSLVAYYMWRVADTRDFYRDDGAPLVSPKEQVTPKKQRRTSAREVTP